MNKATEADRLVAALMGNKMAAESPKMWYMIQNAKESGHRFAETKKLNDSLRSRLLKK